MAQGRPKGETHGQKTFRFDDVVIFRDAIGFMAAELFDGLAGIEIFLGGRDNAHDRRRCRGQHGIIEQYRAGYGIWHFEMTEVEGRIEAIIRASPQLVERSEEHTSELQSLMRISYAVFCLKKKKKKN